jgi:hypothetical protein
MRLRLAISLHVALLLGMQVPACMALCQVAAEPRTERVADPGGMPCHSEAAAPTPIHHEPEPVEGGCPGECAGCADETPLLVVGLKDVPTAAPALLIVPAPFAVPRALEAPPHLGLRPVGLGPPLRPPLLVTSSLRL